MKPETKKRFQLYVLAATVFSSVALAGIALAQDVPSKAGVNYEEWQEYCKEFHDPTNNNGWSACPAPTTEGEIKNGDIDVEGVLLRDTLDPEDKPTYAAIQALMRHLVEPNLKERIPDEAIKTPTGEERVLLQQQVRSARTIASDVVAGIVARRTMIPLSDSEKVAGDISIPGGGGAPSPGAGTAMPNSTPSAPVPGCPGSAPVTPGDPPKGTHFDIVIGDSIGWGTRNKLGGMPENCKGGEPNPPTPSNGNPPVKPNDCTRIGRQTSIITRVIKAAGDAGMLTDKNVLISTGLSNSAVGDSATGKAGAPGNAALEPLLRAQFDMIKNYNPKHVVILGMASQGPQPPGYSNKNTSAYVGLNDMISSVAGEYGFAVMGPLENYAKVEPAGVHPLDYTPLKNRALEVLAGVEGTAPPPPSPTPCKTDPGNVLPPEPTAPPEPSPTPAPTPPPPAPPVAGPPFPPCSDDSPGPCMLTSWGSNAPLIWSAKAGPEGDATTLDPNCPYYAAMQDPAPGSYEALSYKLGLIEGLGRYYIRNYAGYLGKFQMGEAYLAGRKCVFSDGKDNSDYGASGKGGYKIYSVDQERWGESGTWSGTDKCPAVSSTPYFATIYQRTATDGKPKLNSEEYLRDACLQESMFRTASISDFNAVADLYSGHACAQIVGTAYRCNKYDGGACVDEKPYTSSATVSASGVLACAHLLGGTGCRRGFSQFYGGAAASGKWASGAPPSAGTLYTDAGGKYGTPFTSHMNNAGGFAIPSVAGGGTCGIAAGNTKYAPKGLSVGKPPKPVSGGGSGAGGSGGAHDSVRPVSGDTAQPNPLLNGGPPKPISEIVHEIRLKAGVDPSRIGVVPSRNEIMLAMTKERFLDPSYFVKMTESEGTISAEQVMVEAWTGVQLQDIYELQEQINTLLAARAGLKISDEARPAHYEATGR